MHNNNNNPQIRPFEEDVLFKSIELVTDKLSKELCCDPKELVSFLYVRKKSYFGEVSICWGSPGLDKYKQDFDIISVRRPQDLKRIITEVLDDLNKYLQPTIARLRESNLEKIKAQQEADWNSSLKSRLRGLRRLTLDNSTTRN
jgi:hypothetical protein